ncbi:MAG: ABC transporter permease [Chloroflexota bacterium]|nr:ABC transporter permease [Chloroflexota bacterium]
MAALEIARVNLLRVFRDRTNLFFVFLLPLILIIAMGAAFGGAGASRLGLVSVDAGLLGDELVNLIEAGEVDVDVRERSTLEELQSGVEDGQLEFGLLIPPGYDEALRDGEDVELTLVARPEGIFAALGQGIEAAAAEQSAQIRAARITADHVDIDFEAALEQVHAAQGSLEGISVETTTLGEATFPSIGNPFALGAQSQTVLFMFLTSMTAATQLIVTRQLGVSRRMLATPTPLRSILIGELLGRFGIAMMQGLFIVIVSSLLFSVTWGSLPGASMVIVSFALIGTGAAMVVGVFARNPDQAGAIGMVAGMLLAALGGAMVPGELFPEPISTISMLTPHYWAIDAFRDLVFEGASTGDILTQLAVLAAYAALLVGIGIWGLRRSLTRG